MRPGINTYQYNADGMLTASSGAQYVYDALNQRVEKTVGGAATEYVYFQGSVLAEINPGSAAWTDMIYANGSMIAEVAGNQTATPEYRLLDHLGSLALQTDNSGNVTGANVFLPFGQLVSSTTNDAFQFTGLEQGTENSSDHAWFRNYSTEQSRWLRPDPYNGSYDLLNPQSFNRYAYVGNNPLSFVDPFGLEMVTTCDASGNCVTMDDGTGEGGGGGGGGYSCGDNCVGVIAGSPPTIDPGTVSLGDLLPPDSPSSSPSSPSLGNGPTPTGSTGGGILAPKKAPVTISVNEILAGQITYQQSTNTICASFGLGASFPPTKAVTVGILNAGDMANWQNVMSGWSYTFGVNLILGYQGMFSSSGKVGGPTVSGIGLSGSYTYGGCTTLP